MRRACLDMVYELAKRDPRVVFIGSDLGPGVLDQMMAGASRGCRVVVVGVCMEQDLVRPLLGITRELNLQFVLGYTPEEFAATLHHIAEGDLPVAPLITGQVGLEEVAGAFAALANPERHAKILVEPARA